MNISIEQTVEFLRERDNFTILCHVNPDGDTLGSGYALCGALHVMGKNARVLCADEPSERFDYLLDAADDSRGFDESRETIVTVDVADVNLLGEEFKEKYGGRVELCIDHHVSNQDYAARTLLDAESAACAEVMWEVIKAMGIEVTPEIAAAVYTGVSTDTGCFSFSNTTARSHSIAAELMGYEFDVHTINYLMFEMKTRERVMLEQYAYNSIEYFFKGKCAVISLTADRLKGLDSEDTSGVSSLPKRIQGVDVGVVIKEKSDNVWKISVRSNRKVNAQQICAALGGGGHFCAAGCTLEGCVTAVKTAVLREIEKQL